MVDWVYVNGMPDDEDCDCGVCGDVRDAYDEGFDYNYGVYNRAKPKRPKKRKSAAKRNKWAAQGVVTPPNTLPSEHTARASGWATQPHRVGGSEAPAGVTGGPAYVGLDDAFNFGKFAGYLVRDVINHDGFGYFRWILLNTTIPMDSRVVGLLIATNNATSKEVEEYKYRCGQHRDIMAAAFFRLRTEIDDEASGARIAAILENVRKGL